MSNTYQKRPPETSEPAVPEPVMLAMQEITADICEGLLAMAVGCGLQVMAAMMEADVTTVCGPKGRHDPNRTAVRHGSEDGSVTLGGRRVPVTRPRARKVDGSGELAIPTYQALTSTEVLGRMAMGRMLAKLSTRRYGTGLEPVGDRVAKTATGTSKSAVSRRFVTATETALEELLSADLSGLDLVAFMVDGVHFAEHTMIVALGIGIDGVKHPLGVVQGSRRERHPGQRTDHVAARPRLGRDQAGAGRAGRVGCAAPRGAGRVRPSGDRPLSAAQDP